MILNVRKYKIENIDLERYELKLLLLLSDNKFHSQKECLKYLDLFSYQSLYKKIRSINNKLGFKIIKNKLGIGYKTQFLIQIDY